MIYLDNAATSFPKPPEVWMAMEDVIKNKAANPGRSGHKLSIAAGRVLWETRELLCEFLNADDPEEIVFTANATEALNIAIKGILRPGDHCVITSMEHNSVARPVYRLQQQGVELDVVTAGPEGLVKPDAIRAAFKPHTRLVVVCHASNLTGSVQPVAEIGRYCRANNILFLVDAAQTAGLLPLDVKKMNADLLAFPGHKGLYGPPGTGVLYVRKGLTLTPLIEGGTGSNSESLEQPATGPDRYESGTPNTVGIAGLQAGLRFVQEKGLASIADKEKHLLQLMLQGLQRFDEVEVYGPDDIDQRVPVVPFNIKGVDASEVGFVLDQVYDIAVRTGLHCAPLAHRTIGTLDRGAIRVSFSYFNSTEDVHAFLSAIETIIREIIPGSG